MADNSFKSPTGRYIVRMREIHHYIAPPHTGNVDDVNHVRYAFIFLNTTSTNYYIADYNDVYDANSPTRKKEIFSSFIWSPKDDFVVLPEEGWARAPGTSSRTAINLNLHNIKYRAQGYYWRNGSFHMDDLVWADDFRVFGNVYDDCEDYVSLFDGKTGETKITVPSKTPIGYSIIITKNRKLIIKSRLDNCSTDKDEKTFVAECLSLDMDSLQKEKIKCP